MRIRPASSRVALPPNNAPMQIPIGTPDAIVTPPNLGASNSKLSNDPRSQSGGKLSGPQAERSEERSYSWRSCSQDARDILEYMRDLTPAGGKHPWRSGPSVTPIQRMLDDGIDGQDLVDLVEGAARLIRAGRQSPKWWYPGNLFGPRTCERWLADVAELEDTERRALARDRELAKIEIRAEQERLAARTAPRSKVVDLELAGLQTRCMAQIRASEAPESTPEVVADKLELDPPERFAHASHAQHPNTDGIHLPAAEGARSRDRGQRASVDDGSRRDVHGGAGVRRVRGLQAGHQQEVAKWEPWRPPGGVGVFRSISQRDAAEEALRGLGRLG